MASNKNSDVLRLIEMGYAKERAEYALSVTNNKGLEPAMEWLLAHEEEELPPLDQSQPDENASDAADSTNASGSPNNKAGKEQGSRSRGQRKDAKSPTAAQDASKRTAEALRKMIEDSSDTSSKNEIKTNTSANANAKANANTIANANANAKARTSPKANAATEKPSVADGGHDNNVNKKADTKQDNGDAGPSTSAKKDGNNVITSFVCDDCKKICYSEVKMEYHFMKTGHCNFSESAEEKKPLTEEERKRQLALIEERLKQKRLEREEREKVDAIERERNRIRSGKDLTEARKRLEEIEMKKLIEQRKREKAEEKTARERVKAQIEDDKVRRRIQQQKATEDNQDSQSAATSEAVEPEKPNNGNKQYTKTRIQIRLHDGSTIAETFGVKEQLSAVRLFIQIKTDSPSDFGLMTTFPRKVFTDEDYDKPLDVLGLVPSVVLYMTKVEASF